MPKSMPLTGVTRPAASDSMKLMPNVWAWLPGYSISSRWGSSGRAIGKEKGLELRPGDLVTVETGGGGGYGSPRERSLAAIQRDIDAGYVSRARAMIDYDVTIDEQGRVAYSPEGNATSEASRARGSDV